MKNWIATIFFLGILVAIQAQKPWSGAFQIHLEVGHVGQYPDSIYFSYYNTVTKSRILDSSAVIGGHANFKGNLVEPILVQLRAIHKAADHQSPGTSQYPRDYFSLYLEPGSVTVKAPDSLQKSTVTGSLTHQQYAELTRKMEPWDKQMQVWGDKYEQSEKMGDKAGTEAAEHALDSLDQEAREKVYKAYVLTNGQKTPVALYALNQYAGYDLQPDSVEPLLSKLAPAFRNFPSAKELEERIEVSKKTAIGRPALDFTQDDTSGHPVQLSSFRGKYVLVDFWASWCGPCRAENPNVVKAYQTYKDKNFTILSVSLDRPGQREKWIQAIHKDQLTWNHVSDLQYWNNAVARLYGIMAIPQNLLLDPRGTIIARNLRGEELEKKLSQFIN